MFETLWEEFTTWWESVPPDFAFLLVMPFVVAAAGVLAELWRQHGQEPSRTVTARPPLPDSWRHRGKPRSRLH